MNCFAVATLLTALVGLTTGGVLGSDAASKHTEQASTSSWDSSTSGSQAGWQWPGATPQVLGDGTLADTAEVAAARAAHLAAVSNALATNPDHDDGEYDAYKYGDNRYGVVAHHEDIGETIRMYQTQAVVAAGPWDVKGSAGPWNSAQELSSGLEASKSAEALWNAQNAAVNGPFSGTAGGQNKPFYGPLAMPRVLPSGYLSDTAEVEAAKQTHLQALGEAEVAAQKWRAKQASQAWD